MQATEVHRRRNCRSHVMELTHYEDTKVNAKWTFGWFGRLRVTQGHRQHDHSIEHMTSHTTLIETMRLSCTDFEL